MVIAETINDVRKQVKQWRAQGLTVGLVPTMGALHEGHASLVDAAAAQCDRVVASIFVNPTQFAANEDLESYPRNFETDCRILAERGCHMVFHPAVSEMYPAGFSAYVNLESDMTKQLCGKSRPTHFRGVCTVVSKLFHIVAPDKAFFGEKDAQQLAVIRQMVRDLDFALEVVGCPTVREEDGLAKSSRNAYLNEEERKAARVLYQAILTAQKMITESRNLTKVGSSMDAGRLEDAEGAKGADNGSIEACSACHSVAATPVLGAMRKLITAEPLAEIDYVEAVDGVTLQPVDVIKDGDLIALAVGIGKTRLIDNFTVRFEQKI